MPRIPAKQLATDVPVAVGQANAEGNSNAVARANHVHDHGTQPIGTGNAHAVATTSLAGFHSAADKARFDQTRLRMLVVSAASPVNVDLSLTTAPNIDGLGAQPVSSTRYYLLTTQSTRPQRGLWRCVTDAAGVPTWTRHGMDVDSFATGPLTTEHFRAGMIVTVTGGQTLSGSAYLVYLTQGVLDNGVDWVWVTALTARATSSVDGLLAAADKVKLDTLTVSPTVSSATPAAVATAGSAGSASPYSREDHAHAHGSQPLGAGTNHAVATVSIAGFMSAADKTKVDTVASNATNTPLANVGTELPAAVGTQAAGNGTAAARWNHVHAHGEQPIGDGTNHAVATSSVAGFMSATDKTKMDTLTVSPTASSSSPAAVAAASNAGAGTAYSRADHVHAHGSQTTPTDHALATVSAHGFMADVDKSKLEGSLVEILYADLATTANIAVGAFANFGTIDGVPYDLGANGDFLLLVKNQTLPRENGLYTTAFPSGALVRIGMTSAGAFLAGRPVFVLGGAVNARRFFNVKATSSPFTLNTTDVSVASGFAVPHGVQTDQSLHAVATPSLAGFMSATDKLRIDLFSEDAVVQNSPIMFVRPAIRAPVAGTSAAMASNTVYCIYMGYTLKAMTVTNVRWFAPSAGAGTDSGCQVGLGTSPAAPNLSGFATVTPTAVGAIGTPTANGNKTNSSAFSVNVPAGTHLWALVKSNMTTTQLSSYPIVGDVTGSVQSKGTAGTLAVGTPIVCTAYAASAPDLTLQV